MSTLNEWLQHNFNVTDEEADEIVEEIGSVVRGECRDKAVEAIQDLGNHKAQQVSSMFDYTAARIDATKTIKVVKEALK